MSEENLQAKHEKERLIDLLFPSRKKDEKSLDNNVIKAVNYESKRDESLDSQFYPNKEKTIGIEANEKSLKNIDNPRIMNEVNDDFLQDEMDDNQPAPNKENEKLEMSKILESIKCPTCYLKLNRKSSTLMIQGEKRHYCPKCCITFSRFEDNRTKLETKLETNNHIDTGRLMQVYELLTTCYHKSTIYLMF